MPAERNHKSSVKTLVQNISHQIHRRKRCRIQSGTKATNSGKTLNQKLSTSKIEAERQNLAALKTKTIDRQLKTKERTKDN